MKGGRRLAYEPGLDGLRGIAVAAVLAFHAGFSWARGGYLGVSVFFTLSGFLITSLLLAEQGEGHGISLTRFWSRRLRRLMPAALACLALVIVLAVTTLHSARAHLRGDVLGALFDVANWRFLFAGQSYADLFALPSPVLHYWSLAIEEQFYLVFPLLVWFVLVRRGRSRTFLAGVLGVLWLACAGLAVTLGSNHDLVYYATFTRGSELLIGALLALAVVRWPSRLSGPAVAGGGLVAFALSVAVMVTTSQSSDWLYRGGLPVFGLCSSVVVAGARAAGPLRRALSVRPLVELGRISYGVYLYHWPVFLVLTPARVGWSAAPLFVLRVAVTLALAIVSFVLLEQPIRRGRALQGRTARLAPPIAAVALIAAVIPAGVASGAATPNWAVTGAGAPVVTLPPATTAVPLAPVSVVAGATTAVASGTGEPPPGGPGAPATAPATGGPATAPVAGGPTTAAAVATTGGGASTSAPPAALPPPTPAAPAAPLRLMVVGDSTAKADAAGLIQWGADTGQAVVSDAGTQPGCGLVRRGRRMFGTKPEAVPGFCQNWPQQWAGALSANPADAAVLFDAPWDTTNHQLPGSSQWVGFGDPAYDTEFAKELATGVDALLAKVPTVVLVTSPYIQTGWGVTEAVANDPINDHARMDRLNALLREVAAERPGVVVVDLAGHLDADPAKPLTNADLRPDGVHFTPEAARTVADWLGPAITTAIRGA